jgi:rod shape determining protein RodA
VTDTLSALTSRLRAKDSLDLGLLWGLIALGVTGVIMIYSATREPLLHAGYNPHYYLERQGLFVILGIVAMYVTSLIDYRRLEMIATPLYVAALLGLAGVFVVGQSALGAQRWYNLGFIQIQPSEFTVLILILAIATFCQRRPEGLTMYDVARLIVMTLVPMLLIFRQPDLGTTIIIVLVVGAMMVIAGVPPRFMTLLAVVGSVTVVAGVYLQVLHKYQIDRFISFINQNSNDPRLAALIYEVNNAKVAIGSGGLHGAGFFQGLQTVLGYVPEQRTDFIFTAIGEQLGSALIRDAARLGRISDVHDRAQRQGHDGPAALHRCVRLLRVQLLREHRHDDGHHAGDRHPAAAAQLRGILGARLLRRRGTGALGVASKRQLVW